MVRGAWEGEGGERADCAGMLHMRPTCECVARCAEERRGVRGGVDSAGQEPEAFRMWDVGVLAVCVRIYTRCAVARRLKLPFVVERRRGAVGARALC